MTKVDQGLGGGNQGAASRDTELSIHKTGEGTKKGKAREDERTEDAELVKKVHSPRTVGDSRFGVTKSDTP